MADVNDWMSLSKPDPEWQKWVESIGGQVPDLGKFPSIPALREWIKNMKVAMSSEIGGGIAGVTEKDHQVSVRDGSKITCRVYSPEKPVSGGSPLAVIYHGGGWCIGGLENEELLCRLITSRLGFVSVNVDYRLAPEYQFPIPVEDCHDATKWAAANASSLGADPSKGFIISGTSAGGNMVAGVSHICRDEGLQPAITGCHLMIPALCFHKYVPEKYKKDYRSWEQNKDAEILSQDACHLFANAYIPDDGKDIRADERYCPLLNSNGHKNLPPAYFQICGSDPLRDEALIYERILREEEGIHTKLDLYPGLPHGYWSIAPQLTVSKKFVEESVIGIEWLLKQA